MKTLSLLQAALPLTLAALAVGCASPASSPNDGSEPAPTVTPNDSPKAPAPASTPVPEPAPAASTPAPPATPVIATAKIHASPVWHYAVANDAVWVATGTAVERTAPDGTAVAPVPALADATSLATDGTRIYAVLDKGTKAELVSAKTDGSDGAHHLDWSFAYGEPGALALHAGRAYFSATNVARPAQSMIVSLPAAAPAGGGNTPWVIEEYVDALSTSPAFTTDRFFAVDFYRQSAVRVSTADTSQSVDVIQQELPFHAGGIATDGKDVFTRTTQGIVKVAIGSGANSEPTVVVPSATCSIFDPADGSESILEDALAVDGTTLYTACRAGANVEIRAYATTGTLTKVVATAPYTGGVSHLRVTSTAAYWLTRTSAMSIDSELWRAAK
jgi:hypothetical protein